MALMVEGISKLIVKLNSDEQTENAELAPSRQAQQVQEIKPTTLISNEAELIRFRWSIRAT